MIRSGLGFKALMLSAFVLGLMALTTSAAQAELLAKWRVNGADVGALAPQLEIKEIENKTASLAFTTKGGTSVLILCTATKFDEGGKLIAQGGISLGRVLSTGCVVLLNHVSAPNCKPKTTGKAVGELLTLKFKSLIVLDKLANGDLTELVKVTPEDALGNVSRVFVHIELGDLCAIGEEILVETSSLGEGLWIKDIGGNAGFLTESVTHLAVEADAPLHKLLALGQPASIVGSAVVELCCGHAGLKWSGVPG